MRIVIAGSSGFIGAALVARLRAEGHDVARLVRRTPQAPDELSWSPSDGQLDPATLTGADIAINLAGAGVGDKRWNEAYKREIRSSRVDSTVTLSRAIAASTDGPRVLLNASAIGYYGDRGDEPLDEHSPPGDGFLPNVCRAWEAGTQAAEDAGVRVCHLRSGLVLASGGGLLQRLVTLFKAGVGGKLGNGRQYVSWISLADEIGAIRFLMGRDDLAGPVNLTAPAPVTNAEFTRVLSRILHRPAILPVPKAAVRLALGQFSEDVLASTRAIPVVLTEAGFHHEYADLAAALQWALAWPDMIAG